MVVNSNETSRTRNGAYCVGMWVRLVPLWAFGALAMVFLDASCASAELHDASNRLPESDLPVISKQNCPDAAVIRCVPQSPNAFGCRGEPWPADAQTAVIPLDATYPSGCVVNIPAPYTTPQGECLIATSCVCTRPSEFPSVEDGGSQWDCKR